MKFETRALHVGQAPDPHSGAVIPPITLSTTFAQSEPGQPIGKGRYEYARTNNPTRESFEKCVASLERATHALAFSSGIGATVTLVHTLRPGDHVVVIDDVYGGTQRYFRRVASEFGVEFSFVDFTTALESSIQPGKTKMIWLETPTNPTMKVIDIAWTAAIAHKHECLLVVDNTFMSP